MDLPMVLLAGVLEAAVCGAVTVSAGDTKELMAWHQSWAVPFSFPALHWVLNYICLIIVLLPSSATIIFRNAILTQQLLLFDVVYRGQVLCHEYAFLDWLCYFSHFVIFGTDNNFLALSWGIGIEVRPYFSNRNQDVSSKKDYLFNIWIFRAQLLLRLIILENSGHFLVTNSISSWASKKGTSRDHLWKDVLKGVN